MSGARGDPIEGTVLIATAAKASVGPDRLPRLVDRVQASLAGRREEYARRYERVYESADYEAFFVENDHWRTLGAELGLGERETDAVRRAHHEQLLRDGREQGCEEEFRTALEIRDCVVIGT
ncbi:hypothetical protein BRC83_01240 [Halobacteriales archaeon QS_1_68_17]|nr:MAG: hypothetical protein BRC83_01240 [Halobacteriales archaeon QS_1_68_17]